MFKKQIALFLLCVTLLSSASAFADETEKFATLHNSNPNIISNNDYDFSNVGNSAENIFATQNQFSSFKVNKNKVLQEILPEISQVKQIIKNEIQYQKDLEEEKRLAEERIEIEVEEQKIEEQ